MDGLEVREPDPNRSKILGALLKTRPKPSQPAVAKDPHRRSSFAKVRPER
jgi:hypothetical protein